MEFLDLLKTNFTWILNSIHPISWQLIVIFCICYFRIEIKELFKRCTSLSGPGFEGQFQGQQSVQNSMLQIDNKNEINVDTESLGHEKIECNDETKKELHLTRKLLSFERTYRLIFGSQLMILQELIYNPIDTFTANNKFEQAKHAFLPASANFNYATYYGWLISSLLIEEKGTFFHITEHGKEFMNYLNSNNIPLFKWG